MDVLVGKSLMRKRIFTESPSISPQDAYYNRKDNNLTMEKPSRYHADKEAKVKTTSDKTSTSHTSWCEGPGRACLFRGILVKNA